MNTYIVRPYYGYDCNSRDGFNNGHYLDELYIDAESEEDAIDKAMTAFKLEDRGILVTDDPEDLGDTCLAWITCYVDDDGNDVPKTEWENLNESAEVGGYLYQYIDFGDVRLTKENNK